MSREKNLIERNISGLEPAVSGTIFHIPHDRLVELMRTDFKGFRVTSRKIEFDTDFHAADMRWNHMDFAHRPAIHGLYENGLRIAMGQDVCMGISPWPWTPILIPTFDLRVSENEFRQILQIAGVFTVVMRMSIVPIGPTGSAPRNIWRIEWSIASKWYFRFLHRLLHSKIEKLNRRLFDEDAAIKAARSSLRRRGFNFKNADVDYRESSVLHPRNVERPAAPALQIRTESLAPNARKVVKSGEREFVAAGEADGSFVVWDAVCGHQGGPLNDACREGDFLRCPWHGLKVAGAAVSRKQASAETPAFSVELGEKTMTITPHAGAEGNAAV